MYFANSLLPYWMQIKLYMYIFLLLFAFETMKEVKSLGATFLPISTTNAHFMPNIFSIFYNHFSNNCHP